MLNHIDGDRKYCYLVRIHAQIKWHAKRYLSVKGDGVLVWNCGTRNNPMDEGLSLPTKLGVVQRIFTIYG